MLINDSTFTGNYATALRFDSSSTHTTFSVSAGNLGGGLVGFTLKIPSKSPSTGMYSNNPDMDTYVSISYSVSMFGTEYNSFLQGGNAIVTITKLDGKIIEGTFSGRVVSDAENGGFLDITEGKFSAAFD